MAKCDQCDGTILVGGVPFQRNLFCGELCVARYKAGIAEMNLGKEAMDQAVLEAFQSKCRGCQNGTSLDIYTVSDITSFILVFTLAKSTNVCCAACARKHCLVAAGHTMLFGIWSPRGLGLSILLVPYNLLRGLFTFKPSAPSERFAISVKAQLGDRFLRQIR